MVAKTTQKKKAAIVLPKKKMQFQQSMERTNMRLCFSLNASKHCFSTTNIVWMFRTDWIRLLHSVNAKYVNKC